jgi:hypothetical protein
MSRHPNEEQFSRIAARLLKALHEEGGATLKAGEIPLRARIARVLLREEAVIEDLDRQASVLLNEHLRAAPPGIDRQKMLLMIRKKLAKEQGVPL